MFSLALSKPVIGLIAAISAALPAGGAIVIYKNSTSSSASAEKKAQEENVDSSLVSPVIEKRVENLNEVIIVEVSGGYPTTQVPSERRKVKCKLENGTSFELCSLSKIQSVPDKKWVDIPGFNRFQFDAFVDKNLITKEKHIYKARVHNNLITEWIKDQSKKLLVFAEEDSTTNSKPLATWNTTFVISKNNQYTGKMQYVLGRTDELTGAANDSSFLTIEGKYFQCALPVSGSAAETYKNCSFYIFDKAEQPGKEFNQDVFALPLSQPTTIKKGVHYLMKFDEPIDVVNTKYVYGQKVKVKIFSDSERKEVVTTGITQISVNEVSPFGLVKDGEEIDMAVIV